MRVLGLEGTAWAASAAVYDTSTESLDIESDAYEPESGGIHPRDAAEHMASAIPTVLESVLDRHDVASIDAVAFSRGPGLGPCLRIVGTAARSLAQRLDVPLVAVNHMVAHLEVGRQQAGFDDPIGLNASGANAHVLGYQGDRYRVLGETMDTGIGNAIDKFTRELGWSHPGGPKVETQAAAGDFHEFPYVVKGMDFSFAGITSAAIDAVEAGVPVADVCCGLQETVFAMVTEVSERALALTGRSTLVLGGGVGQNDRLQTMLREMCADRGAQFYAPRPELLRDNAGMIAMLGATMAAAGATVSIEDSSVRPSERPDQVAVPWRSPKTDPPSIEPMADGAEARVSERAGNVVKCRESRSYRHPELNARLRRERTAREARLLSDARRAGVPTPVVRDVDLVAGEVLLEHVGDTDLTTVVVPHQSETVGEMLARLHSHGIVHGDPTPRNVRVDTYDGGLTLIDFGLGFYSDHVEDRAMDLHVYRQSIAGAVADAGPHLEAVLTGYEAAAATSDIDGDAVLTRLAEIDSRGRYRNRSDAT